MRFSTSYIIGFSAVVCVVCAVLVSGSAVSLKSLQDRNVLLDRQKNVLAVAGLIQPGKPPKDEDVERIFRESIRARVIDLATGEEDPQIDANTFDQRRAARAPETSSPVAENLAKVMRVPKNALVYEVLKDGQVDEIILPVETRPFLIRNLEALDALARAARKRTTVALPATREPQRV